MGAQYTWVGIPTQSPATVRGALRLVETGETQAAPTAAICGAHLTNGWYVIIWNGPIDPAHGVAVARAASKGRESVLVTYSDAHADARSFRDDAPHWRVARSRDMGDLQLEAEGALPIEFSGIRAWHLHDQKHEQGDSDHLLEVPLELARRLVGFQHDTQRWSDVMWSGLRNADAAAEPREVEPRAVDTGAVAPPPQDAAPTASEQATARARDAAQPGPPRTTPPLPTDSPSVAPVPTPGNTLRERIRNRIRVLRRTRVSHPSDATYIEPQLEETERQSLLSRSRARRQARRAARRKRRAAKDAQQAAPVPTSRRALRARMRERVRRRAHARRENMQLPTDTSDLTFVDPGIAESRRKRLLAKSRARRRARQSAKRREQRQDEPDSG